MKKFGLLGLLAGFLLTTQLYAESKRELKKLLLEGAKNGDLSLVQVAALKGGAIEAKGAHRQTPLILAAKEGHTRIVQFLLERRANPLARDSSFGLTALHHAVARGNYEMTKMLLKAGANLEAKDKQGQTALHKTTAQENTFLMALLLKEGANLEAKTNKGCTALHLAVHANNLSVVVFLLQSGADINARNNKGMTPLHVSMRNMDEEILKVLLRYHADPNITTNKGYLPLHFAMANQDGEKKVKILLEAGQTLKIKRRTGSTLLHLACTRGFSELVDDIIDTIDSETEITRIVNQKDQLGNTPLHYACMNAHVELAEDLQEAGADPFARNYKFQKPWDLLKKNKNKILLEGEDEFYDEFYNDSHTPFEKWIGSL